MDLREPKKKKRVRLQAQPSLPISTNENGEWRIYTAHLSASGTCIADPLEMHAVYSMGFFGKGSLSRSFPSFGKRRFGAPPIVRNRQWMRRRQWLEELEKLNADSNHESLEMDMENGSKSDLSSELIEEEEESCRMEVQAEISGTFSALEKTIENEKNENSETECKTSESCGKKSLDVDSKDEEKLEELEEKNVDNNCSLEIIEDEKSSNVDSIMSSEELKETTKPKDNDDSHKELAEDQKLQESNSKQPMKLSKTVVHDLEANSSIEFIDTENCVKKAKMDKKKESNSNSENNEASVICDEPMNVEEVLLDSTEEEEICEIVEKDQNDKRSPVSDEAQIFGNHIFAENSQGLCEDSEELRAEEEPNSYEILVIPDTDSDTENYLSNVKPRIEKDGFPINETLHLTFEETFFLMYGLGCLQLMHYDGSIFSISNAWNYFQQQDKYFIQKYIVYHYFRSKGWIVKPGMKFGGEYLLYKQGPPFYHASYIVVIEVMDADTLIRDDMKSLRQITWKNLIGLERLSETIAKEILFAQILWPSTIVRNCNSISIEALSEFTVRELLWRRWNPKRKQDVITVEEEDSDSM